MGCVEFKTNGISRPIATSAGYAGRVDENCRNQIIGEMKNVKLYGCCVILLIAALELSCNNSTSKKIEATTAVYTCPMHPEVKSDKPGKCPKCGMNLVKVKEEQTAANSNAYQTGYTCPMHPQVHSDTTDTCPICGMQL